MPATSQHPTSDAYAYAGSAEAGTSADKWRYSLYSALVFLVLSLPLTYNATSMLYKGIRTQSGAPSYIGVVLHAIVFLLIVRLMMNLKI
jgi:hypothetical protein